MKPRQLRLCRRAAWGPLLLDVADDRVTARVRGSAAVSIECPSAHATAGPETVKRLRTGLPVLFDGRQRAVLRQPERSATRRVGRRILVEGDAALIPAGLLLRARWLGSMGLEISTAEGAPADRRLVRPRMDLLNAPFLWGASLTVPAVDASVPPDLIALGRGRVAPHRRHPRLSRASVAP
jgi:hypothetical protein